MPKQPFRGLFEYDHVDYTSPIVNGCGRCISVHDFNNGLKKTQRDSTAHARLTS